MTLSLRRASEDDCAVIWRWRNDRRIRKNFLNIRVISWKEHKRWFASLNDIRDRVYMVRKGRVRIGLIRFSVKRSHVGVSVNLNPRYLGKGFGESVIRQGTKKFCQEMMTDKPIRAQIKKDNTASCKSFLRAGYIPAASRLRGGPGLSEYIFRKSRRP